MNPATIRYSILYRCYMAAILLVLAVFSVLLIGMMVYISGIYNRRMTIPGHGAVLLLTALFLASVMAVALVWATIRTMEVLSFRILFLESAFQLHTFSWRGRKKSDYAYEDVARVARGWVRGLVIVEVPGQRPLQLLTNVYEGKADRLLAEFEKRLPPGRMEADLKRKLTRMERRDIVVMLMSISSVMFLSLFLFQTAGLDLLRYASGWRSAMPWRPWEGYQTVSVDGNGAVWFAATGFGEDSDRIGRWADGSITYWDAPEGVFSRFIAGVAGNEMGYPVVVMDRYLLSFSGAEWNRLPLPGKISDSLGYSVEEDRLHFLDADVYGHRYWSCSLMRPECEQLTVPEELREAGVSPIAYRGSPSGPIMAAGVWKEPVSVFQYRQGKWIRMADPLPLGTLLGVAVSADGTLWTAMDFTGLPVSFSFSKGPLVFGCWDDAGRTWRWSSTEDFAGSFEQDVKSLEVDPLGRIWIAGNYRTDDVIIGVTAAAYRIEGEQAVEIVRYTDSNSLYQLDTDGPGLVQGPDGTLWSFDSGLVSLDATAETLPAPIPGWMVRLGTNTYRVAVMGAVLAMELTYLIVLALLSRPRRRPAAAEASVSGGKD